MRDNYATVPLLYALPGFGQMAPVGGDVRLGACSVERFANGELHVRIAEQADGRECIVLGSTAPPDEQLLTLTLVAHTLSEQGAAAVLALVPYLAYARQDRRESGHSLGAAWVAELLRAGGVTGLVTVDVHSEQAVRLFPFPVVSLSPAPLFVPEVRRLGTEELTVVAPDEGAIGRCEALRIAAEVPAPVAWLAKRRTAQGIVHEGVSGELCGRAVIVDDILDTGGTLVSCCRVLREAGVEEITILVTHGLFTGDGWRELWDAGAARLVTTDTAPGRAPEHPRIEVLPVRPLLEQWLRDGHGSSRSNSPPG